MAVAVTMTMAVTSCGGEITQVAHEVPWVLSTTASPSTRTTQVSQAPHKPSCLATLRRLGAVELPKEAGGRADYRDTTDIALQVVLCLDTRSLCVRALRSGRPSVACEADVLVVAHAFLGEAVEGFVLTGAKTLHPAAHIVHHFALDLRP